ncbi:MAG: hypothetical protein ACXIVF_15140 [Rhizobiaceae bacterium]
MIMPALWLATGCTTMRLEDTLPATASQPAPADPVSSDAAAVSYAEEDLPADPPARPTTRGGYPNLNIRPATAGAQLTEAERQERTRDLQAARQRVNQQVGTPAPTVQNAEQIRRMARQREEETLRRIENR